MVHCQGMEGESKTSLRTALLRALDYAFAFFLAAQRAFINADNFFLAAALIAGRLFGLLGSRLCPSTLPNAVSSRLRFACGLRRSSCGVVLA